MKGHGIAGMRTHFFQPEHRAQMAGFPHATHLQMGWVAFFPLHISVRMRLTKEGLEAITCVLLLMAMSLESNFQINISIRVSPQKVSGPWSVLQQLIYCLMRTSKGVDRSLRV